MPTPEELQPKTTLLYYYPHRYLRDIVFRDTDVFLEKAGAGPRDFEAALRQTFTKFQNDGNNNLEGKDVQLAEDDFSTSLSTIRGNLPLLLIKFPQPTDTAEVFYVGVTLDRNPRYFTLELHKPVLLDESSPRADQYKFCEWKSDGTHHLYHDLSEPRPGYLAGAVEALLASESVASSQGSIH